MKYAANRLALVGFIKLVISYCISLTGFRVLILINLKTASQI